MSEQKRRLEKTFFSGAEITASIEMENTGSGNSWCPGKITIENGSAQLEFVQKNGWTNEIKFAGEWEREILPDVFKWIGESLAQLYIQMEECQ